MSAVFVGSEMLFRLQRRCSQQDEVLYLYYIHTLNLRGRYHQDHPKTFKPRASCEGSVEMTAANIDFRILSNETNLELALLPF